MCGISGFVSDKVMNGKQMLDCLVHRGPDSSGQYNDTNNGKHIFIGHNRLRIIDLSDRGNQPMVSKDGYVVISYNGEVYNFKELKNQHLNEVNFYSETDTEVILELYIKFGIEFIQKLNGDFSIAIYDKRLNKLFLIRDRIGVKPLYFYHSDNTLVFGSEIKAIIASGVKAELAEEYLQQYFVFKYVPQNNTLFKNIKRVAPGHYQVYNIDNGTLNSKKYWSHQKTSQYAKLSYKDAQRQLYELIEDATKIRLMADVPVGTFLSGGIDSSIIASFMKHNNDITHYCASKLEVDIRYEGTTSDWYHADLLAKEWGLNLKSIPIDGDNLNLKLFRKTLFYSDDLIADGSQIPSYLITREAKQNSTVIISGMGADELFLGYAGHMITLLALNLDRLPSLLSKKIAAVMGGLDVGKGSFKAYKRYLHKLGKSYNYPNSKYAALNLVGDYENSLSIFNGNSSQVQGVFDQYFSDDRDPFDSIFRFEMDNFLVKNLHYTDRMSMANSVEVRVPYLDHRVIDFACSIDRQFKLSRFGKPKRILKDAFSKILPKSIVNRRKAGFGMPLRSIFANDKKVNELIELDFFNNFNNFSPDNIRRLIGNHVAGREDNSSIIYSLITFKEWYKMHIQ